MSSLRVGRAQTTIVELSHACFEVGAARKMVNVKEYVMGSRDRCHRRVRAVANGGGVFCLVGI